MNTIPPETLISQLEWRYATKRFDPGKKIPDATWTDAGTDADDILALYNRNY